jgi:hypothetical protein
MALDPLSRLTQVTEQIIEEYALSGANPVERYAFKRKHGSPPVTQSDRA